MIGCKRASLFLSALLLTIVGTGCVTPSSPAESPAASPTPRPIFIRYLGHASFLITAPDGTIVICDPYDEHPEGLLDFPTDLAADAVTISHFHADHMNYRSIQGNPQVFAQKGSFSIGTVKIKGLQSDHGLAEGTQGASMGPNTVFVFEIGGIRIVHLGAAGFITQADILRQLRNADVVMVNTQGGKHHPPDKQMIQLLEAGSRTIIPMHYSIRKEARYKDFLALEELSWDLYMIARAFHQSGDLRVVPGMPVQLLVIDPEFLAAD